MLGVLPAICGSLYHLLQHETPYLCDSSCRHSCMNSQHKVPLVEWDVGLCLSSNGAFTKDPGQAQSLLSQGLFGEYAPIGKILNSWPDGADLGSFIKSSCVFTPPKAAMTVSLPPNSGDLHTWVLSAQLCPISSIPVRLWKESRLFEGHSLNEVWSKVNGFYPLQ